MTATLQPPLVARLHEHLSLRDRCLILRGLADRWTPLTTDLALAWDSANPALLEQFMLATITPYTSPNLTAQEALDLMRQLVEQVTALDDFQNYGTIPATLDDAEAYGNAPREVIADLLDSDIDYTLFVLLHGLDAQPCSACKRHKAYAWAWEVADWPASVRCDDCRQGRPW